MQNEINAEFLKNNNMFFFIEIGILENNIALRWKKIFYSSLSPSGNHWPQLVAYIYTHTRTLGCAVSLSALFSFATTGWSRRPNPKNISFPFYRYLPLSTLPTPSPLSLIHPRSHEAVSVAELPWRTATRLHLRPPAGPRRRALAPDGEAEKPVISAAAQNHAAGERSRSAPAAWIGDAGSEGSNLDGGIRGGGRSEVSAPCLPGDDVERVL